MVFGLASVVDMSNSDSTLVDPIVLQDRADKLQAQSQAAALASQQAQQKTQQAADSHNTAILTILIGGAGLLWWMHRNKGLGVKL